MISENNVNKKSKLSSVGISFSLHYTPGQRSKSCDPKPSTMINMKYSRLKTVEKKSTSYMHAMHPHIDSFFHRDRNADDAKK
jgi:hypothetical protein